MLDEVQILEDFEEVLNSLLHISNVDTYETGYRYYDENSLERLQQILFYRELEFPLKEIAQIINASDYNKEEVKERWGNTDTYAQSQKKTAHYTKEDWDRINGERGHRQV